MKMTTKLVRFADLPNGPYTYGSDHMHSRLAICSSQRLLQQPSTSRHQHPLTYHHSWPLNNTPSLEYTNYSPSSLSNFSSLEYSPHLPLTVHAVLPWPSSLSQPVPTLPPPTPDGIRHPITLPPVEENSSETSNTFGFCEPLCPPHLSIDLSQDVSPYIATLRDRPDTSPQGFPANMTLVSRHLPWRIHISPSSVRDMIIALYTALRTRVTDEEMKAMAGKNVLNAFAKRVERAGEGKSKKGVRRVDFLLGYARFVGIEPSDEPGVWKICLLPLS